MPSPHQETSHHDPLKAWRYLVFPPIKANDVVSFFIKAILLLFTLISISLVFFSALSNQFQWLSSLKCDRVSLSDQRKLTVNGISNNSYQETNLSHILFGIAGNAKTWNNRSYYCELWWKPNITRGYVWLEEKPPEKYIWPVNSPPYKVSDNTSSFKYTCSYGSRSALHIARIVKESFELGLDNVRWFVMGDDDTVFFVENLLTVLNKYDHNQMYYIGANSESVEQDVIHSYTMGYGGGGFAISYPLAKVLVRILDGCINRYHSFYGSDQKVQACLSEIGVPLTKELGFHQIDIRGDPYGLLAAHPLAPLVSLHHLDYVKSVFPSLNRRDSVRQLYKPYKMDTGRMLQHSFCYDLTRNWSVSVSWGYTVQLYPTLVTAKLLGTAFRTFKTWRTWKHGPYTFNTRPMTEDPCDRPVVYFLGGVESVGSGGQTLTWYKRHVDESIGSCDQPHYDGVQKVEFVNVTTTSMLKKEIWNMRSGMFESSATSGGRCEGRYLNVNYGCEKKAGICICDNNKNKNKLYYHCLQGKCSGLLGWCLPASGFQTSQGEYEETANSNLRQRRGNQSMMLAMQDDMLLLQNEFRKMFGIMEGMNEQLRFMRNLVGICLMMAIFMAIVGVIVLGKI